MLVPVSVSPSRPAKHLPDFVGYLAPNPKTTSGCVVAHTVTSVKEGVTTARVLNPTDQDIILRKGTHLGEFSTMEESELETLPQVPAETVAAVSSTDIPDASLEGLQPVSSRKHS